MCRLHTEGTQFGCGHYIITLKPLKKDCNSQYCRNSILHKNCSNCINCKRYFDPDESERITKISADFCEQCTYWYQGPGARHR